MTDTTTEGPTRDALIRKAYGLATTSLREKHKDEFLDLQESHAKALGVDWKRPEDPEDKARKAIEALLAEHPSLREVFVLNEAEAEPEA